MNDNKELTPKERWELRKQEKSSQKNQRKYKRAAKRIILWTAVIVGICAAVFIIIKLADNYSPGQLSDNSISNSDWVKGSREAKVVLIEYSDFQCPACANYAPIMKQIIQEFGNEIVFIYRHFPLKQNHRNAELAAWAAEAAGKQNKFWEMHDILFEKQKEWENSGNADEYFRGYAQTLNLNIEQFGKDINSEEIKNKVENDFQSGLRSDINSTPTFFLNGNKIKNPRDYEEFKNIINNFSAF